jgi:hypothetical protein
MKLFRLDEYSVYFANDLMEFLNWYHENINTLEDVEELSELEEVSLDDVVWYAGNITHEDILRLDDYDEVCSGGAGDLQRRYGEIYKLQTYREVLKDAKTTHPFEISCTEW